MTGLNQLVQPGLALRVSGAGAGMFQSAPPSCDEAERHDDTALSILNSNDGVHWAQVPA